MVDTVATTSAHWNTRLYLAGFEQLPIQSAIKLQYI